MGFEENDAQHVNTSLIDGNFEVAPPEGEPMIQQDFVNTSIIDGNFEMAPQELADDGPVADYNLGDALANDSLGAIEPVAEIAPEDLNHDSERRVSNLDFDPS